MTMLQRVEQRMSGPRFSCIALWVTTSRLDIADPLRWDSWTELLKLHRVTSAYVQDWHCEWAASWVYYSVHTISTLCRPCCLCGP